MYTYVTLFFSRFIPLLNRASVYGRVGIDTVLCLECYEVESLPGRPLVQAMCKMRSFYLCNGARYTVSENQNKSTVIRRLTTGIRSEKCVVRRFRRFANVIERTYTNLDSTVLPPAHLGYMVLPIAQATNLNSMLLY
jgi:hypothetical protein